MWDDVGWFSCVCFDSMFDFILCFLIQNMFDTVSTVSLFCNNLSHKLPIIGALSFLTHNFGQGQSTPKHTVDNVNASSDNDGNVMQCQCLFNDYGIAKKDWYLLSLSTLRLPMNIPRLDTFAIRFESSPVPAFASNQFNGSYIGTSLEVDASHWILIEFV